MRIDAARLEQVDAVVRGGLEARYIVAVLRVRSMLIAVLVSGVVLAGVAPAADAVRTESCGSLFVTVNGKRIGGRVDALRVPCGRARAVMRTSLEGEFGQPSGWHCVVGGAPEFSRVVRVCTRARARVRLLRPR